ncbi:MAG TPA: hypothetical protein VEY91_07220 [Candidatus Limnocylindria bacterium]|nr:hypothetical protein [Candidatus Limnocylindria bacterium]
MRRIAVAVIAALACGVDPALALPRGTDDFALGWTRPAVDSAVAARGVDVISSGRGFLTCRSADPNVELESYDFFVGPHGRSHLWRVIVAYPLPYSVEMLASVESRLREILGEPTQESLEDDQIFRPNRFRKLIWVDGRTRVQLGGRMLGADANAGERMLVSWTDRRIQRLIESKRKRERESRR